MTHRTRVAGLPGIGGGYRRSEVMRQAALEILVVADGHAGRGFDGFGGDEFGWVALELVDAVDERGSVDGFRGVGGRGDGRKFLEDIVDVGASDGAGLTGGCRVDGKREHRFERAELDGALDLGGHGVTAFRTLGDFFRDSLEDATERGRVGNAHVVLDSREARAGSRRSASVRSAEDSAVAIGSKVRPVCEGKDSRVRARPGGRGGRIWSSDSGRVRVSGERVLRTAARAFF